MRGFGVFVRRLWPGLTGNGRRAIPIGVREDASRLLGLDHPQPRCRQAEPRRLVRGIAGFLCHSLAFFGVAPILVQDTHGFTVLRSPENEMQNLGQGSEIASSTFAASKEKAPPEAGLEGMSGTGLGGRGECDPPALLEQPMERNMVPDAEKENAHFRYRGRAADKARQTLHSLAFRPVDAVKLFSLTTA